MNKKYILIGGIFIALVALLTYGIMRSHAQNPVVILTNSTFLVSTSAGLLTISNNATAGTVVITTNK